MVTTEDINGVTGGRSEEVAAVDARGYLADDPTPLLPAVTGDAFLDGCCCFFLGTAPAPTDVGADDE